MSGLIILLVTLMLIFGVCLSNANSPVLIGIGTGVCLAYLTYLEVFSDD